ncbi:hypothetical protein [uncultured Rikenella sp.]|uniref:hypothetical protein n=1 Tax=uncultured Rikenella sp. TaxID=368003 RepID=UPI0025DDBAC7|nr:hypothetical protein [uncultured Rikenella sp.]
MNVGNGGYGRSSTSYDSGDHCRGVCLNFYTTVLHSSYANYHADGLQLRCLSE